MNEKKHFENLIPEKRKNEQISEALLEAAILNSKKINEGNNGIINIIKVDNLPLELKQYLNLENEDGKEIVFKMLKIYKPGKGEQEYKMQTEAYDLVADKGEDYAKVPKPFLFKTINIYNNDAKRRLADWGFSLPKYDLPEEIMKKYNMKDSLVSNDEINEDILTELEEKGFISPEVKVDLLMMDYVEGEDMGQILYKEVLKRNPEPEWFIDNMSKGVLGFEKNDGEYKESFGEEMIKIENINKMIKFLKKNGFVFKKEYFEKLKNTLNILKNKGIKHRDLHERNIIINQETEDVYIIDFGESAKDNEEDSEKKYIADNMILDRYESLTISHKEDVEKEKNLYISELKNWQSKLEKNKNWQVYCQRIKNNNIPVNKLEADVNIFVYGTAGSTVNDMFWKMKSLALLTLAKNNPEAAKELIEKELSNKKIQPLGHNYLNIIYRSI
jgi:serine/threonine protein kinase